MLLALLALELLWGHEALDLRGLRVLLTALGGHLATNDELAHVLTLTEVEELADLGGTLWSEAHWLGLVSEAGNLLWALGHHNKVEDGEVVTDNAATNRLPLHLTSATAAVSLGTLAEEETDTVRAEDTLHHGETLLVVSARDTELVTLELVAEGVTDNFLGNAFVEERKQFLVVLDIEGFLGTRFRAGNVEQHF